MNHYPSEKEVLISKFSKRGTTFCIHTYKATSVENWKLFDYENEVQIMSFKATKKQQQSIF